MTLPANTQKWASAALGAVSLLLLVNLIVRMRTPKAHSQAAVRTVPRASAARTSAADDLARYDPVMHVDVLKTLEARPLPDMERNLFDFVSAPAPVNVLVPQPQAVAVQPAPPPAPPPPPPMLVKPEGFNEMPGGVREVILRYGKPIEAADSADDQTMVVREGDVVMSRYKVLKITPGTITVEDASTHQTAELPIPQ